MLKKTSASLLLIIILQFAVAGGAYAFSDVEQGQWQQASTIQSSTVQLGVYQYSQNGQAKLRSRSDVIREVKRKYNAEVLKISLDERQQVYRVRVLMPNGKVRNLQISARR